MDPTQLIVAILAASGLIVSALVGLKGRKQESTTTALEVNVDANNALIDQLQETVKAQSVEIDRYRDRLVATDERVTELEEYLEDCQRDRSNLEIEVAQLKAAVVG